MLPISPRNDIMTNAWSLLYDVMIKADGYSSNEDGIIGANGEDEINLGIPTISESNPLDDSSVEFSISVPDLPETPDNNNGRWKYHEDKILKDIHDYVSGTYRSHYTGKQGGFKDIQTIDLMAAKGLASGFCQSNIIKYGTRYGDKDGQNKKDLLKVIHYAMLLLHFDDHYKPTNSDYPY